MGTSCYTSACNLYLGCSPSLSRSSNAPGPAAASSSRCGSLPQHLPAALTVCLPALSSTRSPTAPARFPPPLTFLSLPFLHFLTFVSLPFKPPDLCSCCSLCLKGSPGKRSFKLQLKGRRFSEAFRDCPWHHPFFLLRNLLKPPSVTVSATGQLLGLLAALSSLFPAILWHHGSWEPASLISS